MKKSELRKLIKEEIGNYPELHKVITDKDKHPFLTNEEWEDKWKNYLKEAKYVSFSHDLIKVMSKPLQSLLGDNNNTLNRAKLIDGIYELLKKYSSLDAR